MLKSRCYASRYEECFTSEASVFSVIVGWIAEVLFHFVLCLYCCVMERIKTHGSVSCGPRKRGARKRSEYIDRNNKVAIFTHP